MATQIQQFLCNLPAGITPAAPTTVPMQLGVFTIDWVEIDVESGPNGNVGFYLATSRQQYIPFRVGTTPNWIIANGVSKHWDLHAHPTSGDWSLVGYNTGVFPHAITVTWGLNPVDVPAPSSVVPASIDLSGLAGAVS